jgi:hypothetical protein
MAAEMDHDCANAPADLRWTQAPQTSAAEEVYACVSSEPAERRFEHTPHTSAAAERDAMLLPPLTLPEEDRDDDVLREWAEGAVECSHHEELFFEDGMS